MNLFTLKGNTSVFWKGKMKRVYVCLWVFAFGFMLLFLSFFVDFGGLFSGVFLFFCFFFLTLF